MQVTFHGAAREVTGSCHLIEVDGSRILLDCGMIQGGKERHARNREPFPFDPTSIDCVVLSHAHIDHSGRLPLLVKRGFTGPIYAAGATTSLCQILLSDSGHIQEEDARWKIVRLKKQKKDSSWVTPLYTKEEALQVLPQFESVAFDTPRDLPGIGTLRFHKAGHILGAAIVELTLGIGSGRRRRRLVFSGDLGVEGDRDRRERGDRTEQLFACIEKTVDRGGKLVIPSFAVGRTQELLARINDLAGC